MNINSDITSETLSALYALAMLKLKQPIATSCVVKNFALFQSNFLNKTFEIDVEFRNMKDLTLRSLLLFDSEEQTFDVNTKILNLTILFFKDSGPFNQASI